MRLNGYCDTDFRRAKCVFDNFENIRTPKGTPDGWVTASNAIKQTVLSAVDSAYNHGVLGLASRSIVPARILSDLIEPNEEGGGFNTKEFGKLKYLLEKLFEEYEIRAKTHVYEFEEGTVEANIYLISDIRGKKVELIGYIDSHVNRNIMKVKGLESFL